MATATTSPDRALREPPISVDRRALPRPDRSSSPWGLGRQVCLATLIAAAVVLPRSYLIARAHSESIDDIYHLKRGLAYLTRSLAGSGFELNDPPLGEGLVAIPLLVSNLMEGRALTDCKFYDAPGRAETIAIRTALWNSALFVVFLAVVFSWCRSVYGAWPAWFAVALFVFEPNFAAHIPIAALDVVGVEGIVIGAFLAWRYFERPTTARLIAMGFGAALALLLKHTAVMVPPLILALAGLHWVVRPWIYRQDWGRWKRDIPGRLRALALLGAIVPTAIWALSLFDYSPPMNRDAVERQSIGSDGGPVSRGKSLRVALERALHLDSPWPAGCYLNAFRTGMGHGMTGHLSYLNGERRQLGWRSYYPIVASYKVPIGIGVILLLSFLTLFRAPPRWAEWGLFLPMLAWTLFMMNSKVNLGFRHFLPPYAFMLMLGSRCLLRQGRIWSTLAWSAVAATGIHPLFYYSDYLCYINAPWTKPYLAISDCNVDWGQALKQVRTWLDAQPREQRPVSLYYFGNDDGCVSITT